MKRHFPIKSGQTIEMALVIFNSLSELNIPTEICGPPPEVIPNIPVRRNRDEPFHLN